MKQAIEQATHVLVGLPLSRYARAVELIIFGFGKFTREHHGEPVELPEYSLLVQCHWRLLGYPLPGFIVGSGDIRHPHDPSLAPSDIEGFDWKQPGTSLCDRQMKQLMDDHASRPLVVESLEADDRGTLSMRLAGGYLLEIFPDSSPDRNGPEQWVLTSSRPDQQIFVVTDDNAKFTDQSLPSTQ
jgi:hypothetical protein